MTEYTVHIFEFERLVYRYNRYTNHGDKAE